MRFLLLIIALALASYEACAENYCTITAPGFTPGVYDTFTTELTTGNYSYASGNMSYTYAGVNKYEVTSGSGNFSAATAATRYGLTLGNFQLFQSIVTPNYLTVASSASACPSDQDYNWILVRSRTPELTSKPMNATAAEFPVGGTFSYSPVDSPNFETTKLFGFSGDISTTFNLHAYNASSCINGSQKLKVPTGENVNILDTIGSVYFDTNRILYQSTGGNPVAAIGATPETLTESLMTDLSKNVFTGIYTEYLRGGDINYDSAACTNGANTPCPAQLRKNLLAFMAVDLTGTTFTLEEATDPNNPSTRTGYGSIYCAHTALNNPADGFCKGTLQLGGAETGAAICLFSTAGANKLMACMMQKPGALSTPVSFVANVSSKALLALTAGPVTTAPDSSVYPLVTVENLSGRYIPTMGYPTFALDRMPAYSANAEPFDDYYGSGTELYTTNAPANCGGTLPACGTSLNGYAKCQLCLKFNPGTALFGSTLRAFKVAYHNGQSTVNATTNLLGSSSSAEATINIVGDYAFNQATSPTFRVLATYSNGMVQDVTAAVAWSFSDSTKMKINSDGVATFMGTGTLTINACLGGYGPTGTCLGAVRGKNILINQQTPFALSGQKFIGQVSLQTPGVADSGGLSAKSINSPLGTISSDGMRLFAPQSATNRMLIWSILPGTDNIPADRILGQPQFTWQLPNNPSGDLGYKSRWTGAIQSAGPGSYQVTIAASNGTVNTYTYNSSTSVATTIATNVANVINTSPVVDATASGTNITITATAPGVGFYATSVGSRPVANLTHVLVNTSNVAQASNIATKNGLKGPRHAWSDGVRLVVADSGNNRVLIWNTFPTGNNQGASFALGQPSLNCGQANAGPICSAGVPAANSLNNPTHVYSDGVRLVVSDTGNHRVLIWKSFPTGPRQPADFVLGQMNMGVGWSNANELGNQSIQTPYTTRPDSLSSPGSITGDGERLFISDEGNHRVLGWKNFPMANRVPADIVIGQISGYHAYANTLPNGALGGPTTDEFALNGASGLPLFWDTKQLFVGDTKQSRILSFIDIDKFPHVIIPTVKNDNSYSLTLDGKNYSYTSDSSATLQEIVDGLSYAVNADVNAKASAVNIYAPYPIANFFSYGLQVDGEQFIYSSDGNATASEIVTGLRTLIGNSNSSKVYASGNSSLILTAKKVLTPIPMESGQYVIYIDNYPFTYNAGPSTQPEEIVAGLAAQINSSFKAKASGTTRLMIEPIIPEAPPVLGSNENFADYILAPSSLAPGLYGVTINGQPYYHNALGTPTAEEIVSGLSAVINGNSSCPFKAGGTDTLMLGPKYYGISPITVTPGAGLTITNNTSPTVVILGGMLSSNMSRLILQRKFPNTAYTLSVGSDLSLTQAYGSARQVYGQRDFNCNQENGGINCVANSTPGPATLAGPRGIWSNGADLIWVADTGEGASFINNHRLLTIESQNWATGGYADLEMEPQGWNFNKIAPGTTKEKLVRITNKGNAPAAGLGAATIGPAPFSYKGGSFPGVGGTCGNILPGGQSCLINVVFSPPSSVRVTTTAGSNQLTEVSPPISSAYDSIRGAGIPIGTIASSSTGAVIYMTQAATVSATNVALNTISYKGSLTLSYDKGDHDIAIQKYINLYGSASLASLTASPSSKDFGTVAVGSRVEQTFTLTNGSDITMASLSPSTASPLAMPFSFKGGVFPGFNVFTANATQGSYTLTSVSSTAGMIFNQKISGPGITAGTFINSASGNTINMAYPAQKTTVNGNFMTTLGTCGSTLQNWGSCTIVVQFSPTAPGPFSTNLPIVYFDGKQNQSLLIPLQGVGQ